MSRMDCIYESSVSFFKLENFSLYLLLLREKKKQPAQFFSFCVLRRNKVMLVYMIVNDGWPIPLC